MLGWGAVATSAAVVAHWSHGPQRETARCGGRVWPRHLASFRLWSHRALGGDRRLTPTLAAGSLPIQRASFRM